MNPRLEAFQRAGQKTRSGPASEETRYSVHFASRVFHPRLMEQSLPKKVFQNLMAVIEGREKLDPQHSDIIADQLKIWAMQHGATHYTHWFQPLTGGSAAKHDSFLAWSGPSVVIEQFRGKDLLSGEPDASSFPSGNLRATHEARGYTAWDPSSFPFLWEGGDGLTLCIPCVYFSWKGEALDQKIPLLRSDEKIQAAVLRLLKMCKTSAERVFSTLGPEQEYFVIDRNLFLLRPDLLLAGRTVYGAPPPKGQELEDHYFSPVKDRVLAFMREFEEVAVRLGIPVKTRHNEVAPAQHELAPLFEKASQAVDHNLLLMELMSAIAAKHDLACLFHEKPFARINGSGKHCNWSLATDTGLNLFDPHLHPLSFLVLLTAVIHAVHEHAGLLRASIASLGNDYRLGGAEAPPTLISIYLGASLDKVVEAILAQKDFDSERLHHIDLGLAHIPLHEADPSDRNRTSFFAFTGNKFEFRAVGASAHCAFPITVINAIVADSLTLLLDEISDAMGQEKELFEKVALPILRNRLIHSRAVLFSGNGYALEWEKEAASRGLPNFKKGFHALAQLFEKKTERAFQGILSAKELHARYEIFLERYVKSMQIEINLMIELFRTQILPKALLDQKNRAKALATFSAASLPPDARQVESLKQLSSLIGEAIFAIDALEKVQSQTADLGWEAKGKVFCEIVATKMDQARAWVDQLEQRMDNALWPLPKYRELLYLV